VSDIRLGDISFVDTADSHGAFWRGAADTEATLLCSVKGSAVADPEVRDKFHALAAAVAGHLARGSAAVTAAPSARWYADLECMKCTSPQSADVKYACAQVQELAELALSPSGRPLTCCKVHTVGAMGIPDMPSPAPPPRARRSRRWY
jgi:hypothetical protein